MKPETNIHPLQTRVLLALLFKPGARFGELRQRNVPSDQLTFHLKALLQAKLIRREGNFYYLTSRGKEFANRFDTEQKAIERQAKVGVCVVAVKKEKGQTCYLFQQRLKEPYFGFHGFVTGKIRWGERIEETARREFLEETGLTGKFKFCGVEHKMDYNKEGEMLEDKFFFVFKATDVRGEFISEFPGGKNLWIGLKNVSRLKNLFKDVEKLLAMVKRASLSFREDKYQESRY
ncbi:MAG: NUDIX domain-containing protein [bacterium]|nr:NUDIX domain-containing protein [bacterium]